jgi:monoamine oxidase
MGTMTRREFVTRAGRYGGGAATGAMLALGLLAKTGSARGAAGDQPAAGSGREEAAGSGRRVLILGAGLCGMSAAYELGKLGYTCEILEARSRPGGRCWTVRAGTRETEAGGPEQTAGFPEGFYMNPGPARIPGHHTTTLGYCKEFGVPIEVFNNVNEAAYYDVKGIGRVRMREATADMRGYVDELLAKAVNRDALDRPLSQDDKEALTEYLREDGGLNPDLFYKPAGARGASLDRSSESRGYIYDDLPAAAAHPGKLSNPLDFETVLKAGFGKHLGFEHQFDQQPTMFQPVGGIDRIARAFEQRVGDRIRYRMEVREIRRTPAGGVRVVYADLLEGGDALREAQADYCICTIPLSVLRGIPADFSLALADAIRQVPYEDVGKIGLPFRRRFWEEDDHIYGGISWTDQNITQIFYPNTDYLGPRGGVLIGYYHFGDDAKQVGQLAPADRVTFALEQGKRIHPQYPAEFAGGAFSVAWQRIPYNLGGWASWSEEGRARYYPILNQPDGPFYLAGEHLTYLGGWMAGALESAKSVVAALQERVAHA